MPDQIVNLNQMGDQQARTISRALEVFLNQFIQIVPQLGPHLLSGGTVTIKTMSGMTIKLGFNPTAAGIILPGGIQPVNPNPNKRGF